MQSAYKAHHSIETTLVKVDLHNDIMLNVDSGSGSFLILLDLSSAFDAIDYDLLCTVFERHLGIFGTALKLLKLFLTDRSQAVIIDGDALVVPMIKLKHYGERSFSYAAPVEWNRC